ncbi:hypothetical protein G3I19_05445 [Streptomyces sp. SID10853]|uniref:hypothetical protein n=1 Tax=Streptomyces sp. SID10853 TaxID=2706028 RepID=UPI0013C23823|nr:hypothetical protein [Streptomyces sp. SID10853]NDZ77980.1 hypothetical protein [Streptomyces sp. SID10853]
MTRYFDELAAALRSHGRPGEEVAATVADLSGYLAETGRGPEEEFGPAGLFAERLTGGGGTGEPGAGAETWKWTCDIYTDRRHLNFYGDQGWEVEGLDRLGRFVCRRDRDAALRWEYRREAANNAAERDTLTTGLAPDGWEPCGHWFFFMYFKRPRAAEAGPDAALNAAPGPPDQHLFFGDRSRGKLKQAGLAAAVSGAATFTVIHFGADAAALPILIGAAIAVPIGGFLGWHRVKRDVIRGIED